MHDSQTLLYAHPTLVEAKSAAEDWSGLRSREERRKLQTRLNVRAHRKRKAAAAAAVASAAVSAAAAEDDSKKSTTSLIKSESQVPKTLVIPSYFTADGRYVSATHLSPISPDHLIPLVQYNVFRASITNVFLTNLQHILLQTTCMYGYSASSAVTPSCPSSSPWSTIPVFPSPLPLFPVPNGTSLVPPSLEPTALQKRTPHPPWIRILPCARMRDNAVRNLHRIDMKDFCADLLPDLNGQASVEDAGMVVWTDPWEARGWEVKPGFLKKWGFLIAGCIELMEATNHYREMRGEERLEW